MTFETGSSFSASRRSLLRGCLGACLAGALWRTAHGQNLRLGAPAPPAMLTTLDGRRIRTQDLAGQVVMLSFWATWCAPCHAELQALSAFVQRHPSGLTVLAFSVDSEENLAEVRRIAATVSLPVGLLSRSSAAGYGRMWRLPVNFIIDRSGNLAYDGWSDSSAEMTSARLAQLLRPLLT